MKTSKKIISLLLSAAIIMSAMVITAVSAAAAADGSEVYFDNSVFNWENVYIYAYGTKENAKWPGQLMSATDDGLYKASFTSAYKSESIIFFLSTSQCQSLAKNHKLRSSSAHHQCNPSLV